MNANSPQIGHCSQTAPVREYRVMWTQQKKQKLKKWHDGTMRLHTFNNRMLLYDEGRSLITDKYLKPGATIGEGDEVEFEQHLATIEEFLQTVIQDLAPVFAPHIERQQQRAARNGLSPARTPRRSNAPCTTTPTLRMPAPQTPIRPPHNPQTPQSFHPMSANPTPQVQPLGRHSADSPVPANRISTPLPLPGSSLHQVAPPPIRNPPTAAQPRLPVGSVALPAARSASKQPLHPLPPSLCPPEPGPGSASPAYYRPPPGHQPAPRPHFPPPRPPHHPAPIVEEELAPRPQLPVQPSRPCPPPPPRFMPPRPQPDPTASLPAPPPEPPGRKRPAPSELAPEASESRPPTLRPCPPPPQSERRSPVKPAEPPPSPLQAQSSTTPESATIRLSDPYRKRNKLQCPPRRPSAETPAQAPQRPPPPPPPQKEVTPPPRKKARTATTAESEPVLMDSDVDSDPFDLAFSPHDQIFALDPPAPAPATKPHLDFRSARTALSGPAAEAGEKSKEREREREMARAGKRFVTRKPQQQQQRKQNTSNDSGPWSGDSGDVFERAPTMRRGGG